MVKTVEMIASTMNIVPIVVTSGERNPPIAEPIADATADTTNNLLFNTVLSVPTYMLFVMSLIVVWWIIATTVVAKIPMVIIIQTFPVNTSNASMRKTVPLTHTTSIAWLRSHSIFARLTSIAVVTAPMRHSPVLFMDNPTFWTSEQIQAANNTPAMPPNTQRMTELINNQNAVKNGGEFTIKRDKVKIECDEEEMVVFRRLFF